MAQVRNNNFIKGISGKVGSDMLFKTWRGKTFLYLKPKNPTTESPKQKENRLRFRMATIYAKSMMQDDQKREEYKAKASTMNLPNAYTAAITEYMRKPQIDEPDASAYVGESTEIISVNVRKKDFEVQMVEVILLSKEGVEIERGRAEKDTPLTWKYRTTRQNRGSYQIMIRVKERTDNFTERLFTELFKT